MKLRERHREELAQIKPLIDEAHRLFNMLSYEMELRPDEEIEHEKYLELRERELASRKTKRDYYSPDWDEDTVLEADAMGVPNRR